MSNKQKISVTYPDGQVDCNDVVTTTYRNAIRYLNPEKVRSLNIVRNSINIVCTHGEAMRSKGKREPKREISNGGLVICTQFETASKYRYLCEINRRLNAGLEIALTDGKDGLLIPEDFPDEKITEGMRKEYAMTRYERNPLARQRCLEHYGPHCICQVCGFDFEAVYGSRENAGPYIEVHHIHPHSEASKSGEHTVDCARDLIPLCANCHRMIHLLKPYLLTPDELREIVWSRRPDHR